MPMPSALLPPLLLLVVLQSIKNTNCGCFSCGLRPRRSCRVIVAEPALALPLSQLVQPQYRRRQTFSNSRRHRRLCCFHCSVSPCRSDLVEVGTFDIPAQEHPEINATSAIWIATDKVCPASPERVLWDILGVGLEKLGHQVTEASFA